MAKLALWSAYARLAHASWTTGPRTNSTDDQEGLTGVAEALNAQIARSIIGTYRGGKGVLVRTPDFFMGDTEVVPATFWVNDIVGPSQLYPNGNPLCPTSGDRVSDLTEDCSSGSPWDNAIVAVVIGSSMKDLFTDWDSIQDKDWGWGVFYPFDSNSCDGRCAWSDEFNGYDCPGGWMKEDLTFKENTDKKGAGSKPAGNPFTVGGGGGGAGCHFDTDKLDQMDGSEELNLVQDYQCQCNMIFQDNWDHWVSHWLSKGTQKAGFEWRGWFAKGKAPTWAMDASACWVSHFRDMIKLQNALYYRASDWNNQWMPESRWGESTSQDRIYWGWNEIPVTTKLVEDPGRWDSIIIKLPAGICSDDGKFDKPECLDDAAQSDLYTQLKSFEDAGKLRTGATHINYRPGSYILFVREHRVENGWSRYFFCRNYAKWDRQILFKDGACYYDKVHSDALEV